MTLVPTARALITSVKASEMTPIHITHTKSTERANSYSLRQIKQQQIIKVIQIRLHTLTKAIITIIWRMGTGSIRANVMASNSNMKAIGRLVSRMAKENWFRGVQAAKKLSCRATGSRTCFTAKDS